MRLARIAVFASLACISLDSSILPVCADTSVKEGFTTYDPQLIETSYSIDLKSITNDSAVQARDGSCMPQVTMLFPTCMTPVVSLDSSIDAYLPYPRSGIKDVEVLSSSPDNQYRRLQRRAPGGGKGNCISGSGGAGGEERRPGKEHATDQSSGVSFSERYAYLKKLSHTQLVAKRAALTQSIQLQKHRDNKLLRDSDSIDVGAAQMELEAVKHAINGNL